MSAVGPGVWLVPWFFTWPLQQAAQAALLVDGGIQGEQRPKPQGLLRLNLGKTHHHGKS